MSFPIYNITSWKFANSDTNTLLIQIDLKIFSRVEDFLKVFITAYFLDIPYRFSDGTLFDTLILKYILSENLSYLIEIRFNIRVQSHFMSRVSFDIP